MLSANFTCCQQFTLDKLFCCPTNKKNDPNSTLMYMDMAKNISIFEAPDVEIKQLLLPKDLPATDIHTFMLDSDNDLIFTTIQNHTLFQNTEIKSVDELIGKKIKLVVPDYLNRFLQPIYHQTIQGNFLKLCILGGLVPIRIIRTFPIFDYNKINVLGGMAIIAPLSMELSGDINKFALNLNNNKITNSIVLPVKQTM